MMRKCVATMVFMLAMLAVSSRDASATCYQCMQFSGGFTECQPFDHPAYAACGQLCDQNGCECRQQNQCFQVSVPRAIRPDGTVSVVSTRAQRAYSSTFATAVDNTVRSCDATVVARWYGDGSQERLHAAMRVVLL